MPRLYASDGPINYSYFDKGKYVLQGIEKAHLKENKYQAIDGGLKHLDRKLSLNKSHSYIIVAILTIAVLVFGFFLFS